MQPLHLYPRPDIQRSRRRQDRLGGDLGAGGEIVGRGDGAEEVVDDAEEAGLLQPDLARRFAAAEEQGAACGFAGEAAG